MKTALIVSLSLLLSLPTHALETKIGQSQAVSVELHDSTIQGDMQAIRVKDVESGKVAQIHLHKQAKSTTWTGFFIIQFFRGSTAPRTLEFSAPGKNPYFTYVTPESGVQKVMLFENSDEMSKQMAQDLEKKAKPVALPTASGSKPAAPTKAQIETQVRQQTHIQEQAQVSIAEEQAKKRMALIEQQQRLSQEEKTKKIEKAQGLVKLADSAYLRQDYKLAEKYYSQATDLDPENETYYYQYGVSLYKNESYNNSLAVLSMAEVNVDKTVERDYYVAMNHLKLKDYDKARKEFIEIREENDPQLSPTSSFFAGNIEFQQQKFTDARKSMEFVLDNSKDPQLDKSAEEMMEQIDKMEAFVNSRKERFRFTFFAGPIYDQNVLNVATNNVATDVQGFRANWGASAMGYWFKTMTSDLGTSLSYVDYYSVNTSFQPDSTLQSADPMEFDLTLPYHQTMTLGNRSLNWELTPAYKSIHMAPSGGSRTEIIRTTAISTSLSGPLKNDLYLSGKLDYASNQSFLTTASSDDDQNGNQYGVTITPTKLLDLKGERSISTDVSYLVNKTNGKNYQYQRAGLGVTYGFPGWKASLASLRAEYANQAYDHATTSRTDSILTLTGALNKEFKKNWNVATTLQYTMANSQVDTYKYNKIMVSALFTYTLSILEK